MEILGDKRLGQLPEIELPAFGLKPHGQPKGIAFFDVRESVEQFLILNRSPERSSDLLNRNGFGLVQKELAKERQERHQLIA
jgi:hypothetical protein